MDRRSFLRNSASGGAAAAASGAGRAGLCAGQAHADDGHHLAARLAGVHDSAQYCADHITAMTDGQLTVELKAAGELVGAFESFDAVAAGQADMYHAVDYYFMGQHPALSFFSQVPFGMTFQEFNNWYYHAGGMELADEPVLDLRPEILPRRQHRPAVRRLVQQGDQRPRRFPGPQVPHARAGWPGAGQAGRQRAEPARLRVYQALSSGAIDGTEWIGPWADEKAGFQEIAKFYYTAGFHEPGPNLNLNMNLDVYDSLTPAQQASSSRTARASNSWTMSLFMANNAAALAASAVGRRAGARIPRFRLGCLRCRGRGGHAGAHGRRHLQASATTATWRRSRARPPGPAAPRASTPRQRNRVVGI